MKSNDDRCSQPFFNVLGWLTLMFVAANGAWAGNTPPDKPPVSKACISLDKQISVDHGTTYIDADTLATAAKTSAPADALYRFVIKNCGDVPLSDIGVTDDMLNLFSTPVSLPYGVLKPHAKIIVSKHDHGFEELYQADRCPYPGKFINVAQASGLNVETGKKTTDTDPAYLLCGGEPCLDIEKQISVDGGVTYFNADATDDSDVPVIPAPGGAMYRFVARNCGTVALKRFSFWDDALGLDKTYEYTLPAGEKVYITSKIPGFEVLDQPDRCPEPGEFVNYVKVVALTANTGEQIEDTDSAKLICTTPEEPAIDLEKQVSVDGGETFHDADDVSNAPTVSAPNDALYRLIVRNTGTVDLVNLVVTDVTLGLLDVPVADLAVGAQRVLSSENAGFGNLFQEDRCVSPGEYPNIAKVMAESSTTGQEVSDSDAAVVICTGEPCINVEKQISVDGGVTFADADNPTDPDVPTIPAPGGAEYRFVIKNCGDVDLENVSVDDTQLGIPPAIVGDLAVGQQIVIDKGNFQFGGLVHPTRCPDPGTYTNIVQVGAQSSETGESVEHSDPAHLICTGAPAIDLEKQISVDNGATYVDADTAASAPSVAAPGGALYRFVVRNTGDVPLTDVVINDSELGISEYLVGELAVNEERTITSGEIGALNQPGRCPTPGSYTNVANVRGEGAEQSVTDTDPAVLICTGAPAIDLEKEISVDGGVTYLDADADGDVAEPAPSIVAPGGALYRFVVRNTGDVPLSNVVINDSELGISEYAVGTLEVNEERIITSGQIGALDQPERCSTVGIYTNVANVSGNGAGRTVTDFDPAVLICTGTPAIDLEKQISVDNGATYVDADTVASAPSIFAPGGALYRFVVRNTGAVPLTDVLINDAELNISDFSVGNLAVNQERIITSGQIGALDQPGRCPTPGTYTNVADVSGIGAGSTVTDSDPANLVCDQPVCDINVEKTCKVVTPPPPISTVSTCKDLKPVTGLTMIWEGPDGVNVRTELGQTFSDVSNGDVISFSTAGGDKDFELTLSGAVSGFSTFHTSCSDDDMNGIEDCGKREGDGKKDGGGVNDWIFGGMTGEKGSFTCPDALPDNPSEFPTESASCTISAPGLLPSCDTLPDKPETLTWRYDGGSEPLGDCAGSTFFTIVNDKGKLHKDFECSGTVNIDQSVTVTPEKGGSLTVNPGDEFTLGLKDSKEITLRNGGGTQALAFHTSCSQPIEVNATAGALTLVAMNGQRAAGGEVIYGIRVENPNDQELSVLIFDSPIGVDEMVTIGPNDTFELVTDPVELDLAPNEVFTNTVTATGKTSNGAMCQDTDSVAVKQDPSPPVSTVSTCKDLKPVTGLTMIWDGPDGVDVRTELGQTFSDVNEGDVISFNTAGGDKDFELTLSGALSGFSTFHTSCSDDDMNGIEDCGKPAGDGKKDKGGLNEWIFDGMAGEKGAFTCP